MSLFSPGDVDLLWVVEEGNEGDKNIKLPGWEFVEDGSLEEFRKLEAHLFTFEVGDGKLERTGKEWSPSFKLCPYLSAADWFPRGPAVLPVPEPMMDVKAAARADWKLGSDVIALVAAAIVSAGRDCCVEEFRILFFCKQDW